MLMSLKILAWLASITLLVIVAVAIALPLLVDPDDFKPQITQLVKEKTGRTLDIQGNIKLSVFPWLGVKLGATALSNAPGFGAEPFVRAESAELRVKLLPLLSKDVRMDTVVLHGFTLNLAKDKSGRPNWGGLAAGSDVSDAKNPLASLAALAIGGVNITNAAVSYDDARAGTHYLVNDIQLRTGALADNTPFDLALDFVLASKQPAMRLRFSAQGKGRFDATQRHYELRNIALKSLVYGAGNEETPAFTLSARLNAQLPQQTLAVSDIKLGGQGMNGSGNLKGSRILDAPEFTGNLKLAELNPRAILKPLGTELPETADANVLTRATLESRVDATAKQLRLSNLKLQLDDSTATGSLSISDFSQPRLVIALSVNTLDLDRYLPPVREGASAPAASPTAAAAAGALPLETLRKLDLDASLHIAGLKAKNLRVSNALITVAARAGDIRLSPMRAVLYQGKYEGSVRLDVRGNIPLLSLNESLSNIQAGPLLKDLYGKDRVTGLATLSAKLTAQGATPGALKRSLSGQAAFSFTDGAVKGINIARLLRDAQATLKGGSTTQAATPDQTEFSELRGTITLVNGVAHNNDLSAKSPLLRIGGEGTADLVKEYMDYRVNVAVVGSLEGQGGRELADLKGVTIPVQVKGPFANLSYRPDLGAALSGRAKAKVEEKLEEQKQKLGDQLQDKLKNLFR